MKKKFLSVVSVVLLFAMMFAAAFTLASCGDEGDGEESGKGGSKGEKNDGTYYLYNGGDECDKDSYIKISGNKWSVQDGTSGKCSIDGDKITLSYKLDADREEDAMMIGLGAGKDGDTIDLMSGTIEDGKITFTKSLGMDLGSNGVVYYLNGKVK